MTRKRQRSPAFRGELARPLYVTPSPFPEPEVFILDRPRELQAKLRKANLTPEMALLRRLVEREKRVSRKMEILKKHFGISASDPDGWEKLSRFLAETFIRGFRGQNRAGAPRRWGPAQLQAVEDLVQSMVRDGMSAMAACRKIASDYRPEFGFPRCYSVSTLYRRYQEARRDAFVRSIIETNKRERPQALLKPGNAKDRESKLAA